MVVKVELLPHPVAVEISREVVRQMVRAQVQLCWCQLLHLLQIITESPVVAVAAVAVDQVIALLALAVAEVAVLVVVVVAPLRLTLSAVETQ
jgi:hypothetical protein